MRIPFYLLASALCCAIAIGACSDGPTGVADEAALSADEATLSAKKPQFDICHWSDDLNGGEGAFVHLNVNGNSWTNGGDGCGGKENPHGKNVGHNGHEQDTNWIDSTEVAEDACEQFCFEDRDDDGWTDDADNCIEDFNPDQTDTDGDGEGDACDPDDDDDGVPDEEDNCPLVENPGQEDVDADGFGAVCDCDDEDENVNPDATEVCNAIDDDCDESVDEDDVCSSACAEPQVCEGYVFGCGSGQNCEVVSPVVRSACWTNIEDNSGLCAGDFICGEEGATDCDENSDCASGFCALSTCCDGLTGDVLAGTCIPVGYECDAPAPPEADIIPPLFKGDVQTATGLF